MSLIKQPENLRLVKFFRKVVYRRRPILAGRINELNKSFMFLLVCKSPGFLDAIHFKTCEQILQRGLRFNCIGRKRRSNASFCRVYPTLLRASICKKPTGVRMGKGKAAIFKWLLPVRSGTILFSIRRGVGLGLIQKALISLNYKLPIKIGIISRHGLLE